MIERDVEDVYRRIAAKDIDEEPQHRLIRAWIMGKRSRIFTMDRLFAIDLIVHEFPSSDSQSAGLRNGIQEESQGVS